MVHLVPEPENPNDPNAVAVKTERNATIGYLSRDVAKSYQKRLLAQVVVVTCPAKPPPVVAHRTLASCSILSQCAGN